MSDVAADGIVYEVNLHVDADIADVYLAWLDAHITQVLTLPGFVSARLFDVLEPQEDRCVALSVHYQLRDAAALETYLREHAPRLRAEGVERFGERVRATRRVMRATGTVRAAT